MCEGDVSHSIPLNPTFCSEEQHFLVSVHNIRMRWLCFAYFFFQFFECVQCWGFVPEVEFTDTLAHEMWLNWNCLVALMFEFPNVI